MKLTLNTQLATDYKSQPQRIRILTEGWVDSQIYCPNCGCLNIEKYPNNQPVADFYCSNCNEDYELKGKRYSIGIKVVDGAYRTMLERLQDSKNPNLFLLTYNLKSFEVSNFMLDDVYAFEQELSKKYSGNRHIKDKIRQQLQILRDKGYLEFTSRGNYRLIYSEMSDTDYIIANWPKDKQDEIYAVKKFLDNAGVVFAFTRENIEAHPEEPADIWVKDINMKFQIVSGDFERHEIVGKAKAVNGIKFIGTMRRTMGDVVREYITRPLGRKSHYGVAAHGITLLINASFEPPWLERELAIQRKLNTNQMLAKLNFDEIYLVCPQKNIEIFP